jgi:hypothetical protein
VTVPPGGPAQRPRVPWSGKRPGQEAADAWTRPPERPTRYPLLARLSDMAHGWLDGRRNLPDLPRMTVEPAGGSAAAAADGTPALLSAPVPESAPTELTGPKAPTGRLSWLLSPRINVLSAWAMEQIRAEEMAYLNDCAVWKEELSGFLTARDAAAKELATAKERLEVAQRPLTDSERKARRLAEQKVAGRPENFVAGRRQNEWDRRLREAERAHQAAITRHADASRQVQLREEMIRDRLAVARAAAGRHHEFAMRRIATYQQQLVRRHRRGADLNLLLMSHPVGPDLPAWIEVPDAPFPGSGRWTGGPYPGEEASSS